MTRRACTATFIASCLLTACGDAPLEPEAQQLLAANSYSGSQIELAQMAIWRHTANLWSLDSYARMRGNDLAQITIHGWATMGAACSATIGGPFRNACPPKRSSGNVGWFRATWFLECSGRGTATAGLTAEARWGAWFLGSDTRTRNFRCNRDGGGGLPLYDAPGLEGATVQGRP